MLIKRIFANLSLIAGPLTLFACVRNPNSPMGNWHPMMGYGYGGVFMWILILILIGVVVYFLMQASKSKGEAGPGGDTALDILKKRYAKGEIDKTEFEEKKRELE